MININSFCCAIFGKSGAGKSSILKEYAAKLKYIKKIVVISPVETLNNSIEIWNTDEIAPLMHKTNQGKNKKSILVRSTTIDDLDYIINMAEIGRNWLICVDEIFLYQKSKRLQEISQKRRHSNTSIVFTERRPQLVDKRFLNESDLILSFQQREPNTLKYLSEYMECDNYDVKSTSPNLFKYHYLVYSSNEKYNGTIQVTKKA